MLTDTLKKSTEMIIEVRDATDKPQDKRSYKIVLGGNTSSGVTQSLPPPKDVVGTTANMPTSGPGATVVEAGVIWEPSIVNSRGHHILENYSGLNYPYVASSISSVCVLPADIAEMMKLNDDQVTQLSESSRCKVNVADLELKRRLVLAQEFYKEIFVVLKVETLDEAKAVFKSMVEEQKFSLR